MFKPQKSVSMELPAGGWLGKGRAEKSEDSSAGAEVPGECRDSGAGWFEGDSFKFFFFLSFFFFFFGGGRWWIVN